MGMDQVTQVKKKLIEGVRTMMHNEQSLIWHIVPSPDHKVREVCAKLRVSHFNGLAAR